jgi:hypothetical protein
MEAWQNEELIRLGTYAVQFIHKHSYATHTYSHLGGLGPTHTLFFKFVNSKFQFFREQFTHCSCRHYIYCSINLPIRLGEIQLCQMENKDNLDLGMSWRSLRGVRSRFVKAVLMRCHKGVSKRGEN